MKRKQIITPLNTYKLSFILFLTLSFCWGLKFSSNLNILVLGIILMAIFYTLLMQIEYPQSLVDKREKNYTFLTYFYENKDIIKLLIFVLLGYAFLSLGIPIIFLSEPMEFVFQSPGFFFAFQWMYFVCFLTLAYVYSPNLKEIRAKFDKALLSHKNKKVFLFFRLHPFALKKVVPLYLALLTLLTNTNFILFFFFGLSFKYHNGIEAFYAVILYLATTLVITMPFFRKYIFFNYGPKSLKILGWNNHYTEGGKILGKTIVFGGACIGLGLLNKEVGRFNEARELKHDIKIAQIYNDEMDRRRLQDPQGHHEGKYPYAKSPLFPKKTGNLGQEGGDLVKSSLKPQITITRPKGGWGAKPD